jgi:cobaltochelatase CobN
MHLLATTSATLDDIAEAVDLGQPPGDIVVLSFADSDLSALAAAWREELDRLPSVRLAHLRDLRHPMSVDLWIERVAAHAKIIAVRLLGGRDWWTYGLERLAALARERNIALAVLPGEDRDDIRLTEASTLPGAELAALLAYFREGGRVNLRMFLRRLARHAGSDLKVEDALPVPRCAGYRPGRGVIDLDALIAALPNGQPVIPIIFYRALLLASDTAPIDALCGALARRGLAPAPLVVTSLKDNDAGAFLRDALKRLEPQLIVTTTAFAAGGATDKPTALDEAGVPVLQVISATTRRAAWRDGARGLAAADLAMHVVLPELDGRILSGAIAFKDPLPSQDALAFTALASRPEPDRVDMAAERIAAMVKLRKRSRGERRIAVLMPDYPGAPGRSGYAVGLDVPASVIALLSDLLAEGFSVTNAPQTSRDLIDALNRGDADASLGVGDYLKLLERLPKEAVAKLYASWGAPDDDPDIRGGAFHFRAHSFGNILVALPPDRGRSAERRSDYHDPELPPRHALVAFGLWLRHRQNADALVHMGAHGTLEWLPGKAVALTENCFPEIVTGPLPVIYPFIVSNPGEAAQAKRRLAAVTIGHLPPPLTGNALTGEARDLERLIDEYAQADGLDRRRRGRLATLIVETARANGLALRAGVDNEAETGDALRRIDAWLCDIKDFAIKDGLHVFGRLPAATDDPLWQTSAAAERAAIFAALDGNRIAPGPAGAPLRGRRDVLPTGRNLYTADPRTLPTPTAMDLGKLAADEVVRAHLQNHGDDLRSAVIDLWGSATLRTGGEEIAQGLTLMGCRPIWDHASGRVTGVEVLPIAAIGRPRVDVTWRISGLFRDLFPAQIALIDAAVQTVAGRDEDDHDNPIAASRGAQPHAPRVARIFGTAPGVYGAGVEDLIKSGGDASAIGAAYLDAVSHSYGGESGDGFAAPGAFTSQVGAADILLHSSDDPSRDLLDGAEDAAFVGGFAAAANSLGRAADLVMLDTTDPQRPRARTLSAALTRIVHGRVNPRFIAGMMRHGPRGAAEFAETVERLLAFATTTGAVASELFDMLHNAYAGDAALRDFMRRENQQAAAAMAAAFEAARTRRLWHPRRNNVDDDLASLRKENTA